MPNTFETHSMNGARAMTANGFEMFRGPVTLVSVESVKGIEGMISRHKGIPVDFRNDGGCRNGEGLLITLGNSLLCHINGKPVGAVDEQEIRSDPELSHSMQHRLEGGLQNVDIVNLPRLNKSHTDTKGPGMNLPVEHFPLWRAQLLGVTDILE